MPASPARRSQSRFIAVTRPKGKGRVLRMKIRPPDGKTRRVRLLFSDTAEAGRFLTHFTS